MKIPYIVKLISIYKIIRIFNRSAVNSDSLYEWFSLRLASFDELSFHVAKEGDRREEGHIRIVYGMSLLTKSWFLGEEEIHAYSI